MILYYYPQCPFCARVLSAIKPLNLDIELRNTNTNPKFKKELNSLTGRNTVPCLVENGKPMFESADIIKYLKSK
ncbi:MAG: glutathione S-transferase N-terminal domain-containing protein [Candidatus Cloacimonetes bacterium]|nr:glutathione S-transferase N-terminal domain-containing protein [Candidatus Cloacimonadota bacterium]